jgi:hypothetical protein
VRARLPLAYPNDAAAEQGCTGKRAKPSPPPAVAASASPEALPSARRPARRYFLVRTAERCEIYSVDPTGTTPAAPTPCPDSIKVGERIRITGMTCLRESDDPERVQPVVCPDPLTSLERRDRGERRSSAPTP